MVYVLLNGNPWQPWHVIGVFTRREYAERFSEQHNEETGGRNNYRIEEWSIS